jgi:hypothetical protein
VSTASALVCWLICADSSPSLRASYVGQQPRPRLQRAQVEHVQRRADASAIQPRVVEVVPAQARVVNEHALVAVAFLGQRHVVEVQQPGLADALAVPVQQPLDGWR